ncbi:DUF4142 domain-containing protein [Sphingomonas sp.]|uniref:DUF4142 domain-containing protein n=1 Tax=Sphingomonas sp. TaxID=28214 RepID=UPI003CC53215
MRRLLLLTALVAGAAAGQEPRQDPGSRQTREFVQAAGQSDTFEMMEAYSALAESRDAQVRSFAQDMLRDHGRTAQALTAATARAGLKPPPMALGNDQSQMLAALQSQRGGDFDRTYWKQQALAHRAALVVQQRYAETGDTPAVRQAAAAAVPIVEEHLAMAERMAATGQ